MKIRTRTLVAAALAAVAISAVWASAAGAVTANYAFNTGTEGWRVSQNNLGAFTPTTFNPAGFISGQDTGAETDCDGDGDPCELMFFVSPGTPAPLAANYGGAWTFDFAASETPGFQGVVYIDSDVASNPELRRTFIAPASGFGRVAFPLTEAGWAYCTITPAQCTPATAQQFQQVLASARYTDVLADVVSDTGETYSLDNVVIAEKPVAKKAKKCKKKKKGKGKKAGAAKKKKAKCKKKRKGGKGKKRRASLAMLSIESPRG
jgi:hypothetical protein